MKFGNAEPMRRMFAAITYCGGGIAATGDAFALTALLGHEHVTGTFDLRIYEYTKLHRLAIEFGAVPDISDFD